MTALATAPKSIGALGALSIGVGGIVGGGFFATFGITIEGARGATPIAFLIGGVVALATAWSYVGLTLRYPGPGGTVGFLTRAFGGGLLPAALSVLLVLSYVAVMSVYASALASYASAYVPEGLRPVATHALASVAIVVLGLVNFVGARAMERTEAVFNAGKLGVLGLFIVAGFLVGELDWSRLGTAAWAPASTVVATGMLGFLAYEGFELIANASADIETPERTLPIAFLGSIAIAIAIYGLAFVVAIGHMSFEAVGAARDFAASATAATFLGPIGFALVTLGAVLASASAINADYFGAAKLPTLLSTDDDLPSAFQRRVRGQSIDSLLVIGAFALLAANFLGVHVLSAATSGGFLNVFAAVNLAAIRLRAETGARPLMPAIALLLCIAALVVMVAEFLSSAATLPSAIAVLGIAALSVLVEAVFRATHSRAADMPRA
jgi:amino acid transporter